MEGVRWYSMKNNNYLDWLKFAEMYINVARDLYNIQRINQFERPDEIILYHCRKGVGFVLKAYFVSLGLEAPTTNDLEVLLGLCEKENEKFKSKNLRRNCNFLNTFSGKIRYPGHGIDIGSEDSKRGLNSAMRVFDFVLNRLGLEGKYFEE